MLKTKYADSHGVFKQGVYEGGFELVGFKCYTSRGVLVLAKDLLHGRMVTLKISLSVELSQGYEEELRKSYEAASLSQSTLVNVFSLIRTDSRCLLVMEDLQSFESLSQLFLTELSQAKRLSIAKVLLKEVSALNQLGFFHNNLNASNVLLSKEGKLKIHEGDCISR